MVLFLVAAALAGAGSVAAARAADQWENGYLRYQRAIAAAEQCGEHRFGLSEQERFATYIEGKIGMQAGAGRRLQLIEQAKAEVTGIVDKKGCGDPEIADLLALYDAELAPLLR